MSNLCQPGTHRPDGDPFLTTKLFIPPLHADLIARPHLTARLDEGVQHKLTLISAPAGYGKTTLLSEWINHSACLVAWVSLDKYDNEPIRFWTYIIAALHTLYPGIGDDALTLLHSPDPPPIEVILTTLINAVTMIPDSIIIILDNYHMLTEAAVHQAMAFVLDHMPPTLHLIIASRANPPLPLARLRGQRQLTELGVADLRFTYDDAVAFLAQTLDCDVIVDMVQALIDHTEGWIVGLHLVALALRSLPDPSHMTTALHDNRYIFAYLAEEVFDPQPEESQAFLTQTAILDSLTGALCAALHADASAHEPDSDDCELDSANGTRQAQAMLEALAQANLFITPLDADGQWYRYHPLFSAFLRNRLQRLYPHQTPQLHRRAATWYERNGFIGQAVHHLVAIADWPNAARLVEQIVPILLAQGENVEVQRLLQVLPGDLLQERPQLGSARDWVLLAHHQVNVTKSALQGVESSTNGTASTMYGTRDGLDSQVEAIQRLLIEAPGLQGLNSANALGSLPEPLNERELAVLYLVSAGRSNQEIADTLVLAVSTVKWYLKTIYRKLQVQNRTEAAIRARELGIVV